MKDTVMHYIQKVRNWLLQMAHSSLAHVFPNFPSSVKSIKIDFDTLIQRANTHSAYLPNTWIWYEHQFPFEFALSFFWFHCNYLDDIIINCPSKLKQMLTPFQPKWKVNRHTRTHVQAANTGQPYKSEHYRNGFHWNGCAGCVLAHWN